jgi:gamma-glutamyltranspeptidase/glutathione hydrolase
LSEDYFQRQARNVRPDRVQQNVHTLPTSADTVYLAAADADGRMVSYIQSNYLGFGSGIVVPGTGIALQNRGAGFTLERGHPNEVAGGKRPFHTIIPGFVTRDRTPTMSFGVMGGPMQPQGHVQMMVRMFVHGQNPQTAADAPRWQVMDDGTVAVEEAFASETLDGLRARGHDLRVLKSRESMGGAQLIYRMPDGYCGASDPRKEGQAVGY